jgi:hypothetical protein
MPAEALSPGRVIRLTAEIIRRDAEVYLLLALLLSGLPACLTSLLAPAAVDPAAEAAISGGDLLRDLWVNLAAVVLSGVLQVLLIHRAWSAAEGQPLPLRASIDRALRLLPALLVLMLLEGLAVGMGLVLLLVPGVILLCCWAVSLPVLAVEPAGPLQALRRSAEMTRGHRWQVLTLGLMFVGVNAAVLILAWFVAALLLLSGPLAVLAVLVSGLANAVLSVLTAIGMTALYRELARIGPAG